MPKVFSRVVALTFAGPIMAAQAYVAPANAAIVAPDVLTPGATVQPLPNGGSGVATLLYNAFCGISNFGGREKMTF